MSAKQVPRGTTTPADNPAAHREHPEQLGAVRTPSELEWLVRLRWIAIGTAAAAWMVASRLGLVVFGPAPLAVLGLLALANLRSGRVARRDEDDGPARNRLLVAQIAADYSALIALLHLSGGAENPLAALLVVHGLLEGPSDGAVSEEDVDVLDVVAHDVALLEAAQSVAAPAQQGEARDTEQRLELLLGEGAGAAAEVGHRLVAHRRRAWGGPVRPCCAITLVVVQDHTRSPRTEDTEPVRPQPRPGRGPLSARTHRTHRSAGGGAAVRGRRGRGGGSPRALRCEPEPLR